MLAGDSADAQIDAQVAAATTDRDYARQAGLLAAGKPVTRGRAQVRCLRPDRLFYRHFGVDSVLVEQVDRFDAEARQGSVGRLPDQLGAAR